MNEPGVTMDGGHPIKPVADPSHEPAEPAASPGYGPSPTAQGVRGYRDLPDDDVELINAVKEMQEQIARVWATIFMRPGTDRRWADIGKTHVEEGVSAIVRSVAKPHDPFHAELAKLMDAMRESTQDQNSAQQSQDPDPDKQTIGDSIRRKAGWGGRPE